MEPSPKRKRIVLSLHQKLDIVRRLDNGESINKLALEFNVGKSSIFDIRNKRNEILSYLSSMKTGSAERKIMKGPSNKELDQAVYKWYIETKRNGFELTGQQICDKAMELNKSLAGSKEFKASSSWLKNFKNRNGLNLKMNLNDSGSNFPEYHSPSDNPNDPDKSIDLSTATTDESNKTDVIKKAISNTPKAKRKRVVLNLKQKMDVIFRIKMGEKASDLAKEFDISMSTLRDLKTNEGNLHNYVSTFESLDAINQRKTMKSGRHKNLDSTLYAWYRQAVSDGQAVSGPEVCEKALQINERINGPSNFKASSGWLHKFKSRHGLCFGMGKVKNQDNSESSEDVPSDVQDYFHQNQDYPDCDVILTVPDDASKSSHSDASVRNGNLQECQDDIKSSACQTPPLLATSDERKNPEHISSETPVHEEISHDVMIKTEDELDNHKMMQQSNFESPADNKILNAINTLIDWVENDEECSSIDLLHILKLRDHAIRKAISATFSSRDSDVIGHEVSFIKEEKRHESIPLQTMYEIQRCVNWILENGFSRIALQFPDGMLDDAVSVTLILENLTNKHIFVMNDTSTESCCVDETAAVCASADAIIHYGHTCLSPTNRPVLYIFGKLIVYVEDVIDKFRTLFPDCSQPIIMVYEVMYSHAIDEICFYLKDYQNLIVSSLQIPSSNFNHTKDVTESNNFYEVIKCHRCILVPRSQNITDYSAFFIGSRASTLANLMISFKDCKFYSYNPVIKSAKAETFDVNKHLKRQYCYLEKVKCAQTIGILVGSLGVSEYIEIIEHLKTLIQNAGKSYYVMVIGKLTEIKMAHFQEIEVFVNVTCIESSLVEGQALHKSIITPFELEVALDKDYH